VREEPGGWGDQSGTVLIWMLMLLLMTLFLGGITVDLWRAFSERRAVAGIVDAAAIAGASGIDEARYRATNEVVLDPTRARGLAYASLAGQGETVDDPLVAVAADGSTITVTGSRDVPFTLMRILLPDLRDAHVEASAVSAPTLDPP
jgi:Flp pilus assembly protein TadG